MEGGEGGGGKEKGFVHLKKKTPPQKKNQPFLQILNARHPFLRVRHHLAEQVGEAGPAELGRPRSVQVAVVDGLAVGGGPETGGGCGANGERLLLLLLGRHVGSMG